MEDLIEQLKNLNLTDKEARVYLSLLELGPSTPYKIAKRARLKRPTAYVIAEELVEKGLIIQVTGEKNKLYLARSPCECGAFSGHAPKNLYTKRGDMFCSEVHGEV